VRRHLSLVLESLSPHVHNIVYKYSYMRIYVHTINAIRRSFVYIYDYIGMCMCIYIYTIICK
jgi:hypothetical protein